jgi:hypothetical protein
MKTTTAIVKNCIRKAVISVLLSFPVAGAIGWAFGTLPAAAASAG